MNNNKEKSKCSILYSTVTDKYMIFYTIMNFKVKN